MIKFYNKAQKIYMNKKKGFSRTPDRREPTLCARHYLPHKFFKVLQTFKKKKK